MTIPFLDLKAHHAPLREEFLRAIGEVIDSGAFASGPFVAQFERDFAAFCGAPYAVGVGNGTDALWLSLLALGVGPGDEVITSPSTFLATAEAISFCGATPVFVDVDERTCTLDPAQIEAAITRQTRAIIPVHLYGQMADMDPILEIARRHGLMVIEDACQAHGAAYKGRRAGSLGTAGCFSFYPGKNLGAFGEAGAVTTASDDLRKKILALRDHGQTRKYHHDMIGWNGRMDGIQGAVLGIKLKRLERNNELRRAHAAAYGRALEGIEGLIAPVEADYGQHVYHIYAVRLPDQQARDHVLEEMAARGVQCGIHYPIPVHLQEAYRFLGYGPGSFPVAEQWASQCLALPMFPELTADQIATVVRELKACVQTVVHRAPTVAVA